MSKFDTSWKAGTSWAGSWNGQRSWDTEALGALHPGPYTLQQAGGKLGRIIIMEQYLFFKIFLNKIFILIIII
jgi:hypothetical protein